MNWYKYLTEKLPSTAGGGQVGLAGRVSGCLLAEKNNIYGVLKDLSDAQGFEQNRFHKEDLFTHSINCYKNGIIYTQDGIFALICLFHDIGKIKTRAYNRVTGDFTFHRHEYVGAKEFSKFAQGLFPDHERERIVKAIQHHQFRIYDDTQDKTIKRWLGDIGPQTWEDIRVLRLCDRMANAANKHKPIIYQKYIEVDNRVSALAKDIF